MMPIRISRTIWGLIIACLAVFILERAFSQFLGMNLVGILGLWPDLVLKGYLPQLLSYMFVHADVSHLVLNMLMLAFIGSELEGVWGRKRFLLFYFFCGAVAGIFYIALQAAVWHGDVPLVGASGGIYGLLLAYGLLFGDRVLLFMMLFPMKARHFIWVLAGVEFLTGLFSGAPGAAWTAVAHLGGMAGGMAYLYGRGTWLVWRKNREAGRGARSRKASKSHLKLVVGGEREGTPEKRDDSDPRTWH